MIIVFITGTKTILSSMRTILNIMVWNGKLFYDAGLGNSDNNFHNYQYSNTLKLERKVHVIIN